MKLQVKLTCCGQFSLFLFYCFLGIYLGFFFFVLLKMEEKVKEIVDIKQRNLAEENQKTMEVLKERYYIHLCLQMAFTFHEVLYLCLPYKWDRIHNIIPIEY